MTKSPKIKFDRTRIMKTAWRDYRFQLQWGQPKSAELWTEMLRGAWLQERERHELEAERARRSQLQTVDPLAYRIETIEGEIDRLKYAPWGVNVRERKAILSAELAHLTSKLQVAA